MRRCIGLAILALFLVTSSGIAHAGGAVLFLTMNGDLWSWNGTALTQRTTWHYNDYPPVVSPNAMNIAYKSTATIAVNAIKEGRFPGGAGELPGNIWIFDLAINDAKRVADQPKTASYGSLDVPDYYIIRSDPSWSPDGQSLAWTELTIHPNSTAAEYNLVTYSLTTEQATVIVTNIPPQIAYEGFAAMDVQWGKTGIAVSKMDVVEAPGGLTTEETVLVYSPEGELISTSEKVTNAMGFTWVVDGNEEYIGLVTRGEANDSPPDAMQWLLVDPKTGKIIAFDMKVELYSRVTPRGLTVAPSDVHSTNNWQIFVGSKVIGTIPSLGDLRLVLQALTLSPGGEHVAYSDGTNVVVQDAATKKIVVPNQSVRAMTWGWTGWRIAKH